MRAFFRRDCWARIFFHVSARSLFIVVLCRTFRAVAWPVAWPASGCARPAAARLLAQLVRCAIGGTAGIEPTTSRSRSAYPATRPSSQMHIMAACDAGAHALPRFCGRCPRALATSLMVVLGHSPSNRAALFACCVLCCDAFALKQASQMRLLKVPQADSGQGISPVSLVVHSHGDV